MGTAMITGSPGGWDPFSPTTIVDVAENYSDIWIRAENNDGTYLTKLWTLLVCGNNP